MEALGSLARRSCGTAVKKKAPARPEEPKRSAGRFSAAVGRDFSPNPAAAPAKGGT
jgi:hypothetical protein